MPILPNFETATKALSDLVPVKKLDNVSLVNGLQSGLGVGNVKDALGKNLNNAINKFSNIPGNPNISANNENIYDFAPTGSNNAIEQTGISEIGDSPQKLQAKAGEPPFSNVLFDYASYNYIWTLSVMTPNHINFPDETYKKGQYGPLILRSGSGDPDNRVSLKNFKSDANPAGKFDFFIENARINGVTGLDKMTGNTNSTGIEFTVVEPYSIGLFFQSIQVAAMESGYKNWIQCPLLLTLEFVGHHDYTKQNVKSIATKHFPLKIMNMEMRVTAQGSSYNCMAVPWNERAYSTQIGTVKTDVVMKGRTVQEMLQKGEGSLQSIINEALRQQAKNSEVPVADQMLFLFPADISTDKGTGSSDDSSNPGGYTVDPGSQAVYGDTGVFKKLGVEKASDDYNLVQNNNVNKIGTADMGFTDQRKTEAIFSKEDTTWDPEKKVFVRGDIIIKEREGQASFKQGTSIPNIINQVILSSDYGRQALQPENFDKDGFITWWRIDTQLYILGTDENMNVNGRYPTLAVYRIMPHKVHHSRFIQPKDKAKGVQEIAKTAIKEYNYMYTGKNLDIIDFQINFNTGFYTALAADSGKNNKGIQMRDKAAADSTPTVPSEDTAKQTNIRTDAAGRKYDAGVTDDMRGGMEDSEVKPVVVNDMIDIGSNQGGANQDDPGTIAARQFHYAINQIADMVSVNLKILGDPFFIGDSGMGNYTAKSTDNNSVTADYAINYQRGEVYIKVYFRNPVDINHTTGLYDFPSGEVVPQFSGLYRVGRIESVFDKGQFTQSLDLMRMPNQNLKGGGDSPPKTIADAQQDNFKPGQGIPDPSIDNDR